MKNNKVRKLAYSGIIAALYAVLTVAIAPLSYGGMQFRVSELLVLFAFIDPIYIIGLTLGCFIANIFSPGGVMDMIFGTMATFLSVGCITLTRNILKNNLRSLIIASLWPTIFNAIIVGYELHMVFGVPLLLTMGQVAFSEFVIITIIGVPLFRAIPESLKQKFSLVNYK
ncbi:Uncharacterized membrane protein [Clostridium cavendishii DSM 21758]|uniref:Uncharacterized membrane protein n=1 Tax=Clostridium cavendishii DSM 21758 TaxID=1121302 RepID=A0A1M6D2L3_9CLOT|nr:QueT transporter family protein [Clostridium cavendishii]SHI67361.1 Uncharacterized membrane protein [Clostridium cavendishii DSM 21758]